VTNNALLVLSSGLLGALLVFVLGELRQTWREIIELEGLLRLVEKEIAFNLSRVPRVRTPRGDRSLPTKLLVIEAWQQTRVRIAQLLLDSERFGMLTDYYQGVREVNDLLSQPTSPTREQSPTLEEVVNLTNKGEDIRQYLRDNHLGDSRPAWRKLSSRLVLQLFGREFPIRIVRGNPPAS